MISVTNAAAAAAAASSSSMRPPRTARSPLSLDLSDLPPLIQPSPPSNTLLITNLLEPSVFITHNLLTIRQLINQSAPIHSWAPLRSFRRIVVSFYDEESAIAIRRILDGESIMGNRIRVYFGEPTPIKPVDQHLHAPESKKLFFISPPPSPPHGWEMRNEEPPNKAVHAEDLAAALAKLHARPEPPSPVSPVSAGGDFRATRPRSTSSTILFNPEEHGHSPDLPAIAVEDLTGTPGSVTPIEESTALFHTARPPVELMDES